MDTKKYSKITNFTKDKIIQFIGLLTIILSFFLILSLLSYSPDDPNFLITENKKIQNLFGYYGSVTSDIIFQSFGLVAYLFCITIFFIGILMIKNKKINIILSNLFHSVIYIFSGSTLISIYKDESFLLIVNGNGGFVGRHIKELVNEFGGFLDEKLIFYILLILTILFFLLSIQFNIKTFFKILKSIYLFFTGLILKKNKLKDTHLNTEFYSEKEINNHLNPTTTQPNLPFKNIKKSIKGKKFILPPIDFLKKPSKINMKVENLINNNDSNSDFFRKNPFRLRCSGKNKKN